MQVDVGTSMLELDSVMRSQELTLALMAAFPAFIVVGSLVGGAYSLLSPTPPDFKRLALRARMEAIALERALQEAVQVEALGWDTMAAESRGMLILQTARLHTALFRLYSTAGIRSARQREEWGAIREDVRRLQDHYADLSLKLATLQRMTRCYKAFAV